MEGPACLEACPHHRDEPDPHLCHAPLLETILEHTDSLLAYLDRDFNLVRVNSAYLRSCGPHRERLVGRNHFDLFPDEENRAIFEGVRDTGEPVRFREKPFTAADQPGRGTTFWDWTLTPVKKAGGEVQGLVLSLTDVTEKVRADRRKDEFLALLAHELRNPLSPLINAVQILQRAPERPEVRQEALEAIDRQVWHMVRLIDDLLDVARVTSGKVRLQREQVALPLILEGAVAASRPLIDEHEHRLTVSSPPGPVFLRADATRLTQVIANLLNNAAKYTPRRGHISLGASVEDGAAVIRVRDDGVGIPAEALPTLFQMFTQVDATVSRSQNGLGVGLALARALTELHGGSIEARSEGVGQGSEFVVRLPVIPATAMEEEPAPAAAGPGPHQGLRVLVVDDSVDSARSLGRLLELMGHEVMVAHDGPRALALAGEHHPEVVVLDIAMPRMDGYEVARQLRERFPPEELLVVGLSGLGKAEDRRRARAAGFDHHLVKPARPAELEDLLGRFRERRQGLQRRANDDAGL